MIQIIWTLSHSNVRIGYEDLVKRSNENVHIYFRIDTMNNSEDDNGGASFFQLSEVRLYTVCGIIAALLLVAIIQIVCTMYKTRKTSRNQKVSGLFYAKQRVIQNNLSISGKSLFGGIPYFWRI